MISKKLKPAKKMKKLTIVFLFVLITNISFGQSFIIKKCLVESQGLAPTTIKLNGEINLTDSTIQIMIRNSPNSIQLITYINNSETWKQFTVKNDTHDIRYTLSPNTFQANKDEYLLTVEVKDKFTNSINRQTLWLMKNQ